MAKKNSKDNGDPRDPKVRAALLEQLKSRLGLKKTDDSLKQADEYESISDVISTGHAALDEIITPVFYQKNGRGGVPRGYLCEFFGPNAGGKSSLCLKLAKSVTEQGGMVLWADAEQGFQSDFARAHGVDLSLMTLVGKPGMTMEEYMDIVEKSAASGLFQLAVVDSLAGLMPKRLLDCNLVDDERIGEKARQMSRVGPRLVSAAKEGNCTIIIINQVRMMVGVMYGDPETTPGGQSMGFFSSLRLRVSQVSGKKNRGVIRNGEEIGIRSKILVRKSRFGPPYKETVVPIYYGSEKPEPFDMLIDAALSAKAIRSRRVKNEQIFSWKDLKYDDLDDLKEDLTPDMILQLAQDVEANAVLDPDVKKFVEEVQKLGE